jgi:hypothetical protein
LHEGRRVDTKVDLGAILEKQQGAPDDAPEEMERVPKGLQRGLPDWALGLCLVDLAWRADNDRQEAQFMGLKFISTEKFLGGGSGG